MCMKCRAARAGFYDLSRRCCYLLCQGYSGYDSVKNALQHLYVLAYCGTLKQERAVYVRMQAPVQPQHDEPLYQCYVTEELEKAKKQAASSDTQWQNHDSVWESLKKEYDL